MKNFESPDEFKKIILTRANLIDVRAPVEFEQGHIFGACNLPILDNSERAHIGTIYKRQGREQAVSEGFRLVSGDNKKMKITDWKNQVTKDPENSVLYCFRGGQRSQITQRWLAEEGLSIPLIKGGYKAFRQFLIDQLALLVPRVQWIPISGRTGSFKTHLIEELQKRNNPIIDLEKIANHRGSAFGGKGLQPSQANFENELIGEMIRLEGKSKIYIEDESRLIGRCVIPESLFKAMREAPIIWVEESLSVRAQNILSDYILTPLRLAEEQGKDRDQVIEALYQGFERSLQQIKNKLGGLRFDEVLKDMKLAQEEVRRYQHSEVHFHWIEKLLKYYYDPLYEKSIQQRNPLVIIKGDFNEILSFLSETT